MDEQMHEPTVLSAAWRYRYLVTLFALVGLGLGVGMPLARPASPNFLATAFLVIKDPSGSEAASPSVLDRYIASQVEVMQSAITYNEAVRVLLEREPQLGISGASLLDGIAIVSNSSSDLVTVSYEDTTPERAVAGANAFVDAYEGLAFLQSSRSATASVERIDIQLRGLDDRLQEVQADIDRMIDEDVSKVVLDQQFEEALQRIVEIQALLGDNPIDEETLRAELDELRVQVDTYRLLASIERPNSELTAAREEEARLIARRADLSTRRDETVIALESAISPVSLRFAANTASPIPPISASRLAAAGLIVGLVAGMSLAYWLVLKRRRFRSKQEPEPVLSAPLVAEIPIFSGGHTYNPVPVRDSPRTLAAESYRFAAASLELRANSSSARSIMAVSAVAGDGNTATVANIAMALAGQRHNVLIVDAHFGNQQLSQIVGGDVSLLHPGLSEVLDGVIPLEGALQDLHLGNDVHLFLMGRGRRRVEAGDLLRRPSARAFFQEVAQLFDVVLVDAPPLLQVAYSSTILGYVDAGLVTVPHGSRVGRLNEVANRMAFIGTPVIGYVYNRSSARRNTTTHGGSLEDVLSAEELDKPVHNRERRGVDIKQQRVSRQV